MRLRDMLAAAVRPWVRVKSSDALFQVDLGEYGVFGPRWSLKISDCGMRREDVIYLGQRERITKRRFGDLAVSWSSSDAERRRHNKCRYRHAANDSKVAA